MAATPTDLGNLLQQRRRARGFSRTRLGELSGIRPATLEAWELGRVVKPPIHDVLRLARVLGITLEEVEAAVFADEQVQDPAPPRRAGRGGAAPLLEQALDLFGW